MLLFVGRISPNKAHERLVEALWVYRRLYDPEARLHLVGPTVTPDYAAAVFAFADELGSGRRRAPRRGSDRRRAGRLVRGRRRVRVPVASTKGSASRCSRRCGPGRRSWHSTPERWARRWPTPGSCSPHGPPGHGGRRRGPGAPGRRSRAGLVRCRPPRLADFSPRPDPSALRRGARPGRRTGAGGGVKLAFVTPRYGTEVIGGAETAARMLAERLCQRPDWEVEVLTSCALDHLTWENTEPAGHDGDQRGDRAPVPDRVAADPRLLRARRRAAGGPEVGDPGRVAQVGRAQRADVPRPGRRRGPDRRRRHRLLPVPVRHHRRRHRRVEGARGAPPGGPRRAGPLSVRHSGAASATSTGSCTTPGPSGT